MSMIPPYSELERHVRRTRMILIWESVWPCLIPSLFLAMLVVGLTLTGVFEFLPATGHIVLLSILSVAMLVALVTPWRHLRWPTRRDILHRLERENGLANTPLQSLEDHISETDDPLTSYLWQKQLGRYETTLSRLRLPFPAPALSRVDRFGITALPVLLLFVGVLVGHNNVSERFSRAFHPLQRLGAAEFSATLWVTPPAYTGQVPRILQFRSGPSGSRNPAVGTARTASATDRDSTGTGSGNKDGDTIAVQVPEGSTLEGSITSIWEPTLTTPDGNRPLTESRDNSYVLSTRIDQPGEWRISVWGNDRVALDIALVADAAPSLGFHGPPTITRRDHVRMDYVASDDYGLARLDLVITPAADKDTRGQFGPVEQIAIDLMDEDPDRSATPTRLEGTRFVDLVSHPWAGLPVNIQLVATDNGDQTGRSDMRAIVLPERDFTHPVARKLITIRRGLLRYPDRAGEMHQAMMPVLYAPQAFDGDIGVFLALSIAEKRLAAHLEDRMVHQDVAGLLWHIAEEIERGSYGIAERNLIEAEERLLQALADPDITEKEITRLIDEYRQALNAYLAALTRETVKDSGTEQQAGTTLEQQDLSRIIDQIDALMRAGARDEARQLIDHLRELVENMQVTSGDGGLDITSALREMLDGMRDLSRRQNELVNQGDAPANDSGPVPRASAQQKLADDAAAIMNNPDTGPFGEVSGMQAVTDAMKRAAEALGHNRSHKALQHQKQAIRALQQGIGEINRALEGLSQLSPLLEELKGTGRRDPLGRPLGGDGATVIPDVDTLERAWRILQELRRRSGDPDRPRIEQEYIDRLLKRF